MAYLMLLILSSFMTADAFNLHTSEEFRNGSKMLIDASPHVCHANDALVIMVKSAVSEFKKRSVVRATWGKLALVEYNITTVFVVARSHNHSVMQQALAESNQHLDLLMADFVDHYYRLTVKSISALTWFIEKCKVRNIAYVDDDIVLNPKNLLEFLKSEKELPRGVYCQVVPKVKSLYKFPDSKFYVPKEIISEKTVFTSCTGPGVLMSRSTARELVATAIREETYPKLWLEDVFLYGVVSKIISMPLIDEPQIRGWKSFDEQLDCFNDLFESSIIRGEFSDDSLLRLWNKDAARETAGCRPFYTTNSWILLWMSCLTAAALAAILSFATKLARREKRNSQTTY